MKKEKEEGKVRLLGKVVAKKIIANIDKSRQRPLNRFIYALGIRDVGATTAKILAANFKTIDELMQASFEKLTSINNIGGVAATHIIDFFKEEHNRTVIERLLTEAKLDLQACEQVSEMSEDTKPFLGKTFVLTGTLSTLKKKSSKRAFRGARSKSFWLSIQKDLCCCSWYRGRLPGLPKPKSLAFKSIVKLSLLSF